MDMHSRIFLSVLEKNRLLIYATAFLLLPACTVFGQANTNWQDADRQDTSQIQQSFDLQPAQIQPAQLRPTPATNNRDQIREILSQGRQMEATGQWAEALSLYQSAIKDFPRDQAIRDSSKQARLHYDLQRRYSDKTFIDTLGATSPTRALNVYAEVLLENTIVLRRRSPLE